MTINDHSTTRRPIRLYAGLGLSALLMLSAVAGSAEGRGGGGGGGGHGGGGRGGGGHGGGRGGGGWGGGYYPAPPVIYGSPSDCIPPLIYAPAYGYGYCE